MLRNMHDSTYLIIFVQHEGEPIQIFYSTKKVQLSRLIHHRYINDILTALSTYSNIVGHVHGPALKRPPYCVHKYFMPQHVLSRNSPEIPGGLSTFCSVTCGILRYYITHLPNFPMLRITANNDKQ